MDKRAGFNKVLDAISGEGWGDLVVSDKTGHFAFTTKQSAIMFSFLLDLILIQDAEIERRKTSWTKEELDNLDKLIVEIIIRERSGRQPWNPTDSQAYDDQVRVVDNIKRMMMSQQDEPEKRKVARKRARGKAS